MHLCLWERERARASECLYQRVYYCHCIQSNQTMVLNDSDYKYSIIDLISFYLALRDYTKKKINHSTFSFVVFFSNVGISNCSTWFCILGLENSVMLKLIRTWKIWICLIVLELIRIFFNLVVLEIDKVFVNLYLDSLGFFLNSYQEVFKLASFCFRYLCLLV